MQQIIHQIPSAPPSKPAKIELSQLIYQDEIPTDCTSDSDSGSTLSPKSEVTTFSRAVNQYREELEISKYKLN